MQNHSTSNSDQLRTAVIDASDLLNRIASTLNYVITKRDPDADEGESWVLGHVEELVRETKELIDAAHAGIKPTAE